MPGLNFFKIYSQQKANLSSLLEAKGMDLVDTKAVTDNSVEFIYQLYFTQKPIRRDIKWIKDLKKHFNVEECKTESYSAVVLVSYADRVYAISFGSSHFLVSQYADFEFGIEIASRLLVSYKAKNSRAFCSSKTKSIETYSSVDAIEFEAGESVGYIKGSPSNTKQWGRNISCGQSVQLRHRTFSIKEAHKLCLQLDAALSLPVQREFPKSLPVKDRRPLDKKLAEDMKHGRYMVSISQQQLSGVAFLFVDQYEFYLKAGSTSFQLDESPTLGNIDAICSQRFGGDYQALLKAPVEAREDGALIYSKPFIHFIDYVDEKNNYYLDEGRWYQFDKNYLTNIREAVDRIELNFNPEIVDFDEAAFVARNAAAQTKQEKMYREQYLNYLLQRDWGFRNWDRDIGEFEGLKIETADLFKDGVVYFVKIGETQYLSGAIDQAMISLKMLERQKFQVSFDGVEYKIAKMSLWFFFERKGRITSLSETKSLIFLMKLANWRKAVLLSGLKAEVRISYKQT